MADLRAAPEPGRNEPTQQSYARRRGVGYPLVDGGLESDTRTGSRMTRGAAARIVTRLAILAGIDKHLTPHSLRHSVITAPLHAGGALRDVQEFARHVDPRTTIRYDRARHSLGRHASYTVMQYVSGAS